MTHFLCTPYHVPIPVLPYYPLPIPTLSCCTFCSHLVTSISSVPPFSIIPPEIPTCHVPFGCCSSVISHFLSFTLSMTQVTTIGFHPTSYTTKCHVISYFLYSPCHIPLPLLQPYSCTPLPVHHLLTYHILLTFSPLPCSQISLPAKTVSSPCCIPSISPAPPYPITSPEITTCHVPFCCCSTVSSPT